jgi:ParB family chromosome partitioning protein
MSAKQKSSTAVEPMEVTEMNTANVQKASVTETKLAKDKPAKENVTAIPIDQIQPFPNHPFQVNEDEAMEHLKESIAQNGVLIPALVRQIADGSYQMVSGHRRMAACKALGMEKMPVIVRNMDDDLATVTMVDANSQREQILPSEKAHAYKMRQDALRHMRATGAVPPNGRITEQIGKENSKSHMTVNRYIRLTRLLPDLLKLVDSKKLKETAAERISFLDEAEQQIVLSVIQSELCVPNKAQAKRLKQMHDDRELTEDAVRTVLTDSKGKTERVSIPTEALERFFSEDETPAQITEAIIATMEQWEKLKSHFQKDVSPVRMMEVILKALENEKRRQRNKAQER